MTKSQTPSRRFRPKLSVMLGFTVITSAVLAAGLSATVVQAIASRTFYTEVQRRLETGLEEGRLNRNNDISGVEYRRWPGTPNPGNPTPLPIPDRGDNEQWTLTQTEAQRLLDRGAIFINREAAGESQRVLVARHPGGGMDAAWTSTVETRTLLNMLMNLQMLSVMLVTLVSMVLSTVAIQVLFRPLHTITRALQRHNPKGDLTDVELPPTQGEFEDLTAAYNAMVRRTRQVLGAQENFLRDAGHELRTPLTSIIGHAGLLIRRPHLSEEDKAKSLQVILKEGERLQRLVGDLQTLTRATNTEGRNTFDLTELTQDVAEALCGGELSHVQVNVSGHPTMIHGNRDHLTQVVTNLMTNAAQANATRIDAFIQNTHGNGVLTIRDNGAGIHPDHLPRIFERFYRTSDSRDRRAGGSGLGLTITRDIVRMHGGDITVDSQLGVGSAFHITLPLA